MKSIFKVLSLIAALAASSAIAMERAPHQKESKAKENQSSATKPLTTPAWHNYGQWLLECRKKIEAELHSAGHEMYESDPLFCVLDNETRNTYFAGNFRPHGKKRMSYAPFVAKCDENQEFDVEFTTKSANPRLGNFILALDQTRSGKITDIALSDSLPQKILVVCSHQKHLENIESSDFLFEGPFIWDAPRVFRLQTNGHVMNRLCIPAPATHIDLKTGKFIKGDSLIVYGNSFKDNHPKEEKQDKCVIS